MVDQDWQQELLGKCQLWHERTLTTAEKWLDEVAAVDLTSASSSAKQASWSDEWQQFTSFGSWPELEFYQQVMANAFHDGKKGVQSVGYWMWLTTRPFLYSIFYITWKLMESILGKLLPTFQYLFVEVCRFQLHLTWRQALGEVAFLVILVATWKFVKYLQKQKYVERTRRYLKHQSQQVTKVGLLLPLFYVLSNCLQALQLLLPTS